MPICCAAGLASTGMDELAAELKAQGIKANAIGHWSWKSTLSKIVQDKASGKLGALVLVGHSQGAINVIEIARALESHKIPVDLLVTLVPSGQNRVPANVMRALNFYQNPGWGTPLKLSDTPARKPARCHRTPASSRTTMLKLFNSVLE